MSGPAIRVEPEVLMDLAQKLRQQSQQVQEVYAKTKAQANVATGEPKLQDPLDAYSQMWNAQVGNLARTDEVLVNAVEASTRNYRRNEQALADMLQPGGSGGGDVSTPKSVPDYVQGLTEGGSGRGGNHG